MYKIVHLNTFLNSHKAYKFTLCAPNIIAKNSSDTITVRAAYNLCRERGCGRDPADSALYRRRQDRSLCIRRECGSDWAVLLESPAQKEKCWSCLMLGYCKDLEKYINDTKIQIAVCSISQK